MEDSARAANVGKIGLGLSLVPWAILPLLLLLPKTAAAPQQSVGDVLRTISFCFYCFSPIALLACIAGLTSDASKKHAAAGAIISGLFYVLLVVLYAAGNVLPSLPRP
jgi:uncharacterized membrane protein YozB (DUF420 family)